MWFAVQFRRLLKEARVPDHQTYGGIHTQTFLFLEATIRNVYNFHEKKAALTRAVAVDVGVYLALVLGDLWRDRQILENEVVLAINPFHATPVDRHSFFEQKVRSALETWLSTCPEISIIKPSKGRAKYISQSAVHQSVINASQTKHHHHHHHQQ